MIAALLSVESYFFDYRLVSNEDCIALVAGCLSGCLLSPDLDCDSGYIGLHFLRIIPIFGLFISWIWRMWWYPYTKLVPHRSWISHFPIISTFIRLVYLSPFLGSLWWFLGRNIEFSVYFSAFVGLCLADTFHWFADMFSGDMNKYTGREE